MLFRCQVSEAWSNLQPFSFSLTLHKKSPYQETLNHYLLKRKETGVFAQIKSRYFGRNNFKATCQRKISKRAIAMEKIFGANVVFGLGVSLAICLFILEILTARVFSTDSVTCQSQQDYDSAFLMFAQKWSPTSVWHSKYTQLQFETELNELVDVYTYF